VKNNIAGKVVVILDAGNRLGAAAAQHLSDEGATLVLGASRVELISELARELRWNGGRSLAVGVDPTDRAQLEHLLAATVEAFGRVDVIVNNVGLAPVSLAAQPAADMLERAIDLSIRGMQHGTAAVLPYMQRQRLGHIINVHALPGDRAGSAAHSATKGAAVALSDGLHQQFGRSNIRMTILSSDAPQGPETSDEPPDAEEGAVNGPESASGVDSFARALAFIINLPEDMTVNEVLFRPKR
jgi:NADP-dependent 3-hydroxy acid dehydrogenase YdfG